MVCPSCQRRPARRACPALGREICPACCGSRRLVDIDCPSGCAYLAAAQAHPPAVARKQQERDAALMDVLVGGLAGEQLQIALAAVRFISQFAADPLLRLTDADVADAASSLGSTYDTAARGLIYEHRPQSLMAQRLATDLRTFLEQARQQRGRPFDVLAGAALRRVADTFRGGSDTTAAGGSGTRLAAVGRVVRAMGEAADKTPVPAAPGTGGGPGSLIIPA